MSYQIPPSSKDTQHYITVENLLFYKNQGALQHVRAYHLDQGWENFSEQGSHSQNPSFKGPHIGWSPVSTYEKSLIYAWFFLQMQTLGQLNDQYRCRSPIQSWKPLTCFRSLVVKSHLENHSHCAEKWGPGGLPREKFFEVMSSRKSKNTHL